MKRLNTVEGNELFQASEEKTIIAEQPPRLKPPYRDESAQISSQFSFVQTELWYKNNSEQLSGFMSHYFS